MIFQDLFKKIQDRLYPLKPKRYTHFFKKNFIIQLYWTGWSWQWKTTNDRSLWTKIRFCEVAVYALQHCRFKIILTNSISSLFLETEKQFFCLFQDFQGPRPISNDFQGPGNFFSQFQNSPGFSRTVATLQTNFCSQTKKTVIVIPYINEWVRLSNWA